MDGYARDVIALGYLDLDLSGICKNTLPPATGEGSGTDRGWCTVDATNPSYFRRPVRDQRNHSFLDVNAMHDQRWTRHYLCACQHPPPHEIVETAVIIE
jgi:hypothetical protein